MWTDDIKDWSGRGMVECIREAGDRDVWKRRVQRSKCLTTGVDFNKGFSNNNVRPDEGVLWYSPLFHLV